MRCGLSILTFPGSLRSFCAPEGPEGMLAFLWLSRWFLERKRERKKFPQFAFLDSSFKLSSRQCLCSGPGRCQGWAIPKPPRHEIIRRLCTLTLPNDANDAVSCALFDKGCQCHCTTGASPSKSKTTNGTKACVRSSVLIRNLGQQRPNSDGLLPTSDLIAMASNLIAMASNPIAMASNLIARASNLVATASNLT